MSMIRFSGRFLFGIVGTDVICRQCCSGTRKVTNYVPMSDLTNTSVFQVDRTSRPHSNNLFPQIPIAIGTRTERADQIISAKISLHLLWAVYGKRSDFPQSTADGIHADCADKNPSAKICAVFTLRPDSYRDLREKRIGFPAEYRRRNTRRARRSECLCENLRCISIVTG